MKHFYLAVSGTPDIPQPCYCSIVRRLKGDYHDICWLVKVEPPFPSSFSNSGQPVDEIILAPVEPFVPSDIGTTRLQCADVAIPLRRIEGSTFHESEATKIDVGTLHATREEAEKYTPAQYWRQVSGRG